MGIAERAKEFLRKHASRSSESNPRVHPRSKLGGVFALQDVKAALAALPRDLLDLAPQMAARIPVRLPSLSRGASLSTEARSVVRELHEGGVAILPEVIPPDLMSRAKRDFETMVPLIETLPPAMRTKPRSTGGTRRYALHEYQRDLGIHRTHDPLMFSSAFAELALLPLVRDVLTGYLGSSFLYQALIATRTAPLEPTRAGFAQWHHDARGCKLNIFLLLTDIPPDGQATIYLRGSHRLFYSYARRRKNYFSEQEIDVLRHRYHLREFECSAPAGSAVFFDANGLHRGRRGPVLRDAFQFNCMTRRSHLWQQEMPRALFEELALPQQRELLARTKLRIVESLPAG